MPLDSARTESRRQSPERLPLFASRLLPPCEVPVAAFPRERRTSGGGAEPARPPGRPGTVKEDDTAWRRENR